MRTIDAHAAGASLRLIIDGWPAPKGKTMAGRQEYARLKQDRLRRIALFEPRGHSDLVGAILTEPERGDSHAGVLFMHNDGYPDLCGHGVIAVVTIALERGLITGDSAGDCEDVALVLDLPAGQIHARAHVVTRADGSRRVTRVSFVNLPSFVFSAGVRVTIGSRAFFADVAFGGAFYTIVDAESAGLPMTTDRVSELRSAARAIREFIETKVALAHPADGSVAGLDGVIFTGPPSSDVADIRNVTVFADRAVDRSPCGAGTSAVLAVIDAMGLAAHDRPFVSESLIGTTISARIIARTTVGEIPAIVPELTGDAWITGEHTLVADDDDPLAEGFRI